MGIFVHILSGRLCIMIKSLFMLMFKNPLFVMSSSGTAVFIVYLLTYPLLKRYFSLKWRYRILKTALFFYLIPVGAVSIMCLEFYKLCFRTCGIRFISCQNLTRHGRQRISKNHEKKDFGNESP